MIDDWIEETGDQIMKQYFQKKDMMVFILLKDWVGKMTGRNDETNIR